MKKIKKIVKKVTAQGPSKNANGRKVRKAVKNGVKKVASKMFPNLLKSEIQGHKKRGEQAKKTFDSLRKLNAKKRRKK